MRKQPHPLPSPPGPPPVPRGDLKTMWPRALGFLGVSFGIMDILFGFLHSVGFDSAYAFPAEVQEIYGALMTTLATQWYGLLETFGADPLLVVAGILLIRRRASARPLLLLYAVTMFALSSFALQDVVAFMQHSDLASMAPENRVTVTILSAYVMFLLATVGYGVPIFLFAWFFRPGIGREISTWKRSPPHGTQPLAAPSSEAGNRPGIPPAAE